MTAEAAPPRALPGWLPAAFLALLVLPFHPFWLDFEQVRRGLLLALVGGWLLVWPRLRPVPGSGALLALLLWSVFGGLLALRRGTVAEEVLARVAWTAALALLPGLGAMVPGANWRRALAVVLLLTAAYGLAQRLGLSLPAGYGAAAEPVSVFGNRNVAAEFTAIAAAALFASAGTHRPTLLALAAAAAYLVVNGSRSGWVALPLALLGVLPARPSLAALRAPGLALAVGALLGTALAFLGPQPPPPPPTPAAAQAAKADVDLHRATLEVRLEIARSGLRMLGDQPILGHGPGQFAVRYPEYRSPREIELSSHGHEFATEVRTAHDDWLETAVEGGVPALLLLLATAFLLGRAAWRDPARLPPLLALGLLMAVRSPWSNAPAVATALLLGAAPRTDRAGPWPTLPLSRALLRLLGAGLLALGALPVAAHTVFAPYLQARAQGAVADPGALVTAHGLLPAEPRFLQLLAQEQLQRGRLPEAQKAAAMASRLRPADPTLLLLVAQSLAMDGRAAEAEKVASSALGRDPDNLELRVLLSALWLEVGRIDDGVRIVAESEGLLRRNALGKHFGDLEAALRSKKLTTAADRCAAEREFLLALSAIDRTSPQERLLANERIRALAPAFGRAQLLDDLRLPLLASLQALALQKPDLADELGARSQKNGTVLQPWQRQLFGGRLEALRAIPGWRWLF